MVHPGSAEADEDGGVGGPSVLENYFRMLSDDALEAVLRNFSARPRHARWQVDVSPSEVALGCGAGHPLRSAIRRSMTAMHAHHRKILPPGQEAVGMRLDLEEQESLFINLLRELAAFLRVLSFDMPYSNPMMMPGAPFVHCTGLRVLNLGRNHQYMEVAPLLRACGSVLRELHMTQDNHLPHEHVKAVTRYCKALTALTLSHKTTDLTLEPLWRAVGGRLTRLALRPPNPSDGGTLSEELSAIATHCTALEDLELMHYEPDFSTMSLAEAMQYEPDFRNISLLEALGTQLRVLRLMNPTGCPPAEKMRRVIALCPNAELHLHVWESLDVLRVAGGRLLYAWIACPDLDDTFRPDSDELQHLEDCTITMTYGFRTFFGNLFAYPKRSLRRLELNQTILSDASKTNLLDIVAQGTSSLRVLKCSTFEPLTGAHADKLLKANREMQSLQVTYETSFWSQSSLAQVERAVVSLIERIVDTNVKKLSVFERDFEQVSPLIEDACVPLRLRGVDVVVGIEQRY